MKEITFTKKEWEVHIQSSVTAIIACFIAIYALTKYWNQDTPPLSFWISLFFYGWSVLTIFLNWKDHKSFNAKIKKLYND